jgi:hypothetical protein
MCVTRVEKHVGTVGQDSCTLWRICYPMYFIFLDIPVHVASGTCCVLHCKSRGKRDERKLCSISTYVINPTHFTFKTVSSRKNVYRHALLQKHLGTGWMSEDLRCDCRQRQEMCLFCKASRLSLGVLGCSFSQGRGGVKSPSIKNYSFSFLYAFSMAVIFLTMNCGLDCEKRKMKRLVSVEKYIFSGC